MSLHEPEREHMIIRRLSDILAFGNAGTWDEVLYAAEMLRKRVEELTAELEVERACISQLRYKVGAIQEHLAQANELRSK